MDLKMSECQCESHQVQCRKPATEARMEMMNNYARTGDTVGLYSSIKTDPQLLKDVDEIQFIHTPLHEAAAFGQTGFALEILNLMPSLGKKLNHEGLSPLHVALEHKKIKTARSLVRMDKQLVRVKGKDGFTPLHLAAQIAVGNSDDELEIIADFLHVCPESIYDLNNKFQTAVHVALESCNDINGSSALLLNWIRMTSRESILAWKDVDGNTALHTAVQYNREEKVEVLVRFVRLNQKNESGKTPLDIALEHNVSEKTPLDIAVEQNVSGQTPLDIAEEHRTGMKKILIAAGALRAERLPKADSRGQFLRLEVNIIEDFFSFWYSTYRDFVRNVRSDIMVVAGLITAATYQAVLQPPGGVYPPPDQGNSHLAMSDALTGPASGGTPGKMVMKLRDYYRFMPANTEAFTLSIVMILLVLQARLSSFFLLLCLMFLAFSYYHAMNIISDSSLLSTMMFFICTAVTIIAFVIKLLFILVKSLIDEKWMPKVLSTTAHNFILDRCGPKCLGLRKFMHLYHLIKYEK